MPSAHIHTLKLWHRVMRVHWAGPHDKYCAKQPSVDRSSIKTKLQVANLEDLETILPHDASVPLTVESYKDICQYLRKVTNPLTLFSAGNVHLCVVMMLEAVPPRVPAWCHVYCRKHFRFQMYKLLRLLLIALIWPSRFSGHSKPIIYLIDLL